MRKQRNINANAAGRRSGRMLLVLLMASAILMSGCITINTPQSAPQSVPQPEQSTAVPESSDPGGGAVTESPVSEAPAGETPAGSSAPAGGPAAEGRLSEDEVIAIVLSRVQGATADEVVALGLDTDDGMLQYEGKLIHDGLEYEFEIDAVNGNILEWEIDD